MNQTAHSTIQIHFQLSEFFTHLRKIHQLSKFGLSCKKEPETFTLVFCGLLLTTRTKRVSLIPLWTRRDINVLSCLVQVKEHGRAVIPQ